MHRSRASPTSRPSRCHVHRDGTEAQDLCATGDSPGDRRYAREARRRARRHFETIGRSLRSHPDAVVSATFVPADAPGIETRELTVRDLAETHLPGAATRGLPDDLGCYRSGRVMLKRLLDGAGRG